VAPTITVRQGDITTYDGDAVVNAANNHLRLGAGVAGAIRRAGGPTIQQECDRHGAIRVGEAAITGAGEMAVRFVIHAAAMGDEPVSQHSISDSTQASLALAAQHQVGRIALPVLGSGIGGFGFEQAALTMLEAIRQSPHVDSLEEIVFYGYSATQAEVLEQLLR
jgi:O-acetyl-ADP-ribose deacetylase (regulator of RNase III)